MDTETSWDDRIVFADSFGDCAHALTADGVLHILCMEGSMSFCFHDVRYNMTASDYAILPMASLVSELSEADGCRASFMGL